MRAWKMNVRISTFDVLEVDLSEIFLRISKTWKQLPIISLAFQAMPIYLKAISKLSQSRH